MGWNRNWYLWKKKKIREAFEQLGWDAKFDEVHAVLDRQSIEHSHDMVWIVWREHRKEVEENLKRAESLFVCTTETPK